MGGTGGGGGGHTDAVTDKLARQTLQSRLKNFSASNCNKVFDAVIDGYTTKGLATDANTTQFYNVNSPGISDLTQNQVSGNGSNTTLGSSLSAGQAAETLLGGTSPAVLLGTNFFSNSNSTYQGNVLLHELLHGYTGWSDAEIFSAFSAYGLTNPNGDTEDISAWLSTDCKSTPTSVTWWGQ
jgi:hypothetical protein